ncbi:flagellar export chaperone FliS [Simiduia aestuariiviva]|uniref:Flagellar protein FliS n=1 Tax=Simiduia aestuariiviva TaxID=1510459 RepID=A0A839UL99_9GAMM|nr:flagellar export chaperone FliS [Simiduia aestuariiviva]MBB3168433.1 flagellar protein FliS [Simiduia aestuariiviva]
MTVAATRAAECMAAAPQDISPHRVIALLLDGALERIEQAKQCLSEGNAQEFDILVLKTVGIINGLRASLDFDQGGEIANNLDAVYDYVAAKLVDEKDHVALDEAEKLLAEIKQGWDGIAPAK